MPLELQFVAHIDTFDKRLNYPCRVAMRPLCQMTLTTCFLMITCSDNSSLLQKIIGQNQCSNPQT